MSRPPTGTDWGELKEEVKARAPREDFQRQEARLEAMAREVRDLADLRSKIEYHERMLAGALNMIEDIKEKRLPAQEARISGVKEIVMRFVWMGTGMGLLVSAGLVVLTLWLNHR